MAIDFSDSFEYANNTAMLSVWSSSCTPATTGVMDVSPARAHSGSKSLKLTFPPPDSEGGCFMDRNLNAASDTFFMRVWAFYDNFSNNTGVPTKMWFAAKVNSYPNFWFCSASGANNWSVAITNTFGFEGLLFGGTTPNNQWVGLEAQITMNTPGVANGVVRFWINDVMVNQYTNLLLRGASNNGNFNTPTSNVAFTRVYRQHGLGALYYDDVAFSRDARIGLGGSPPPVDTTPPAVPTGLGVT